MRFLAGAFLALGVLVVGSPVVAQPGPARHVTAELVSERQGIAPGETIHVALRQQIQKGWHTYWRNSGDSGEATRIKWDLPAGWQTSDFVWPAPRRLPVGPLMNYGFEGEVLLPVALTAPANARPGEKVNLQAKASFLVCAEICVPEDANLTLALLAWSRHTGNLDDLDEAITTNQCLEGNCALYLHLACQHRVARLH